MVYGRRIKAFTIIDLCTRESPWIEVANSIPGDRVDRVLDHVAEAQGLSQRIVCDNCPEFLSLALAVWAQDRVVELDYTEPGKPIQNCFAESFDGTFRDECFNENVFTSVGDAVQMVRAWWKSDNEE